MELSPNSSRAYNNLGQYRLSLEKFINNVWIEIDYKILEVREPEEEVIDFFGFILPNIRGTGLGWLVGLIIVGIFILVPMRLQKGLHLKQQLPAFVYVFMGSMGVVTATILPFFEIWVIAFIVIIAIMYILSKYLIKSSSSSDEE